MEQLRRQDPHQGHVLALAQELAGVGAALSGEPVDFGGIEAAGLLD